VAAAGSRLYVLDAGVLKVFDLSTPTAPVLLGSTDNFVSVAVAASGTLAFLASPSTSPPIQGGLYVVDVSTPATPTMLGSAHLGFASGSVAAANSLAVLGGGAAGMKVMDVSTPSTPRAVGSLSGNVGSVALAGSTAYATLSVAGNPSHYDLAVVSLTVRAAPTIVGRVTLCGDA